MFSSPASVESKYGKSMKESCERVTASGSSRIDPASQGLNIGQIYWFGEENQSTNVENITRKLGQRKKNWTKVFIALTTLYWLGPVYYNPGILQMCPHFWIKISNANVFVKRNWQKKAVYKSQQQAPFIDPTQLGQACPTNRGLSSKNFIPKKSWKLLCSLRQHGFNSLKVLVQCKNYIKAYNGRKCGPSIIICIKADLQKA